MFYNQQKCVELIEEEQRKTSVSYDIVIFFRADIISQVQLPIFIPRDDDTIYVPSGYDWGGLNDQIAHGTLEAMKKYAGLYSNIEKYCLVEKCIFHPETLLRYHVRSCGLNVVRYDFPYSLNTKRTMT
jgi:hypothetical protein